MSYNPIKKVLPGFEPGSLDSKSKVLTITPQDQLSLREIKPFTSGFEPKNYQPIRLIALPFKLVNITPYGTRTRNLQIRSLTRYPIALMGPAYKDNFIRLLPEEGFEPSKHVASDLKSLPFDQTREPWSMVKLFNLHL